MTQQILKISTALSNQPLFIRVPDDQYSLDHIVQGAIETLKTSGKPLDATQLAQLFTTHQIMNLSRKVSEGILYEALERVSTQVGNQTVEVAEITLVTSQSGGV